MSAPVLLTASQAAALLGLRPFDVLGLVESGELPAGRIGSRWVLSPSQVAPPASLLTWG